MRRWLLIALALLLLAAAPATPSSPGEGPSEVPEDGGSFVGEHGVWLPGVPPEALAPQRATQGLRAQDDPAAGTARDLAQVPAGSFATTDCFTDFLQRAAQEFGIDCGYVGTPLRHDDPDGPTIELALAVVRARGEATEPPLVLLAGGPGEKFVSLFPALVADPDFFFGPLVANRDVVIFDQRGVGQSRPALECPEVFTIEVPPTAPSEEQLAAVVDAFAACSDRLASQGVDLAAFNTAENARDLDVVRRALGYDAWDVYGTSYGAYLAVQAARLQPADAREPIRTLTVSSPIPAEQNFVVDVGQSFQQALDRTFAACADDPGCAESIDLEPGQLQEASDRVTTRLDGRPESFGLVVEDFETGDATTVSVVVDAATYTGLLFSQYYTTPLIPFVPSLVDDAEAGRYEALVRGLGLPLSDPDPDLAVAGVSLGMQLSVLCAEQVAATDPEDVRDGIEDVSVTARTFVEKQPVVGLNVFEICARWDTEPAPPVLDEPVETNLPMLVVTGRLDQITPPQYGEQLADGGENRYLVEVPGAGHSPLLALGPCGVEIQAAFLADPGSRPPADCAQELTFDVDTGLEFALPVASRVAGPDRYATAAAQATLAYPDGADVVLLASGQAFPDGLATAALAGELDAPVLLATRSAMPEVTRRALAELDPGRVVVVGGPGAIAEAVVQDLDGSFTVDRIGGEDRFDTAAALARELGADQIGALGGRRTAFVASGVTYPDALAAGPIAFAQRHPILLTGPRALPETTEAALRDLGIERVVILGDTPAVSEAVEARLEQVVGNPPLRLGGPDRYATAARVADASSSLFGLDSRAVLLTRGDLFPDAIAAGPHAAQLDATVLLARPGALPATTAEQLQARAGIVDIVRSLGSPVALSDETVAEAAEAVIPPELRVP